MAKLYPPYIEGSIPAFYGNQLVIPYVMNKTVGYKDILGFKIKIITISTNRIIAYIDSNGYDPDRQEAYFSIPTDKLTIGQFYKIQMAYIDKNNEVGYYSTIGVVKYTDIPIVKIEGLEAGSINLHQYEYLGYYQPSENDPTEKQNYYQFDVYDYNNNLYISTGKKIHNASIDSGDTFELPDTLEKEKTYFIQYTAWTLNGLQVSSKKYRIMQRQSIDIEMNVELQAELNFDEGYISLYLKDLNKEIQYVEGAFVVNRASEEDGYKVWNPIYKFELRNQKVADRLLVKDFTIKQGIKYKYSIQQYNDDGLYSNPLYSNEVRGNFEDCFLYDGERQLKLKYNTKMNSFKTTILEQKVDTIGSKYPYIFRNGNVAYKEFPIQGLISYYQDDAKLFMSEEELNIKYKTTDLIGLNLKQERLFKMAVLDWLNDGNPKIFRSPTEGNFIIRLINNSFSPEAALGRMLHNFSGTAYEIAEFNYKNMIEYGFIRLDNTHDIQMKWETIELASTDDNGNVYYASGILNTHTALTVRFTDMMPGSIVYIDDEEIQIGNTGSYYVNLEKPIKVIRIPENAQYIGFMTYSYYGETVNQFSLVSNVKLEENPLGQIVGPCDVLAQLQDIRTEVVHFYILRFYRRFDYFKDKNQNYIGYLYPGEEWKNPTNVNEVLADIDPYGPNVKEEDFYIWINGNPMSIRETMYYELEDCNNIKSLQIGKGVVCECSYQSKITTYKIESKDNNISESKQLWLDALNNYLSLLEKYDDTIKPWEDMVYDAEQAAKLYPQKIVENRKKYQAMLEEYVKYMNSNDYLLLSLQEAIDYIQEGKDPRDAIQDLIDESIYLAQKDQNKIEEEYWLNLQNIFHKILEDFPVEKYLYNADGTYNKTPNPYNDSEYDENGIRKSPAGFEMDIQPEGWQAVAGISYPIAFYADEEIKTLDGFLPQSLWVEGDGDLKVEKDYQYIYMPDDPEGKDSVYVDVISYIGTTDPDNLLLDVDIWVDTTNDNDNASDRLNKAIDYFRYQSTDYKDIAWFDNDIWHSAVLVRDPYIDYLNDLIDNPDLDTSMTKGEFQQERYIFRLDKDYFLYQIYNREILEDKLIALGRLEDETNTELSDSNKWEQGYLTGLLVEDYEMPEDVEEIWAEGFRLGRKAFDKTAIQLNYFKPISLVEISDGTLKLAYGSSNSIYLQYEDQNLQFISAVADLNNYFYYKTADFFKIKKYLDDLAELNNLLNIMLDTIEEWPQKDGRYKGDITGDNLLTFEDAELISKYNPNDPLDIWYYDINDDNKVNANDINLLMNILRYNVLEIELLYLAEYIENWIQNNDNKLNRDKEYALAKILEIAQELEQARDNINPLYKNYINILTTKLEAENYDTE